MYLASRSNLSRNWFKVNIILVMRFRSRRRRRRRKKRGEKMIGQDLISRIGRMKCIPEDIVFTVVTHLGIGKTKTSNTCVHIATRCVCYLKPCGYCKITYALSNKMQTKILTNKQKSQRKLNCIFWDKSSQSSYFFLPCLYLLK